MPTEREQGMLTRRALLIGGSAACGLSAAIPSAAHHGFGGRYDVSRPIWLQGVVHAASFRPPHPTIMLEADRDIRRPDALPDGAEFLNRLVTRDEDRGQRLEIEFPPVGLFFNLADRVRTGQTIAVVALRNCAAPHQLRGQWIRLADGSVVVRQGRMQSEVDACPAT
jgi:hypothetical protein